MSGSRAKRQRQAARERPTAIVNSEHISRSADAVLAVKFDEVVLRNRTVQVIVGLARAAFAQSKVVAALTNAGLLSAAAPNRRLFIEIALRLHWLQGLSSDERRRAVDTMLDKDRQDTNRILEYLRDAEHEADFDPTEMNAFELDNEAKGAIHQQATRLRAAVDASEVKPWSTYSMWLEETKFAHASGTLAGSYAPTHDDRHMSSGTPDPMDPDLEGHRLIQAQIAVAAGFMLADEGIPEVVASRIATAFFGAAKRRAR